MHFFILLCYIFNGGNELWVSPLLPVLHLGNFFGMGTLSSFPSPFLWSSMQRAFLKGAELMSSSNTSSIPEMFRSQCLPPPASGAPQSHSEAKLCPMASHSSSQVQTGWSQGENVGSCCFFYVMFID